MRRDPALHDLARDHYRILLRCRRVEKAREEGLRALADEFVRFWGEDGSFNLLEEDALLLPFAKDEDASLIRADHEWLRDAVDRLRGDLGRGTFRASAFRELLHRLRDHVRFEDCVFYGKVEAALSTHELEALRARSAEFRVKNRPAGLLHCSLRHAAATS